MTTVEFDNEFDILYDSIASLGAPELDGYEKSVFLTKAQLELIKEVNGPGNKYGTSFEGSDKRRVDMRELIKDYKVTPTVLTGGISDNSFTAGIPKDCFLIKYESAFYNKPGCTKDSKIDIVPIKYDEYHQNMRNPFRRPDSQNGYRLDMKSNDSGKFVELVTEKPIHTYQIRYVQYPIPIVLMDLEGIAPGEGLSVDGISTISECVLDQEFHREILDRAVQLAMLAYKGEALQTKVQLDQRNN